MKQNIYRLLFIEALLISDRIITRRELTTTFLIGNATASRDIADYRKLNNENMLFRLSPKKSWARTHQFEPVFFKGPGHTATLEQQAELYLNALKLMVLTVAGSNQPKDDTENDTTETNNNDASFFT